MTALGLDPALPMFTLDDETLTITVPEITGREPPHHQRSPMSFPYFELVERAHAELLHEGKIMRRSDQHEVEEDKGLLTRRAAYYCFSLADTSIGILEKTTGNNSLGYSVDLLIRLDGTFWDVATDVAGMATPVNGGPSGPDPELAKRWRTPTAELAEIEEDGDGTTPLPPSGAQIPYDEEKSVAFGLACNATYTESGAAFDPGMISVHSQRCAWDYYVAGMPWNECLLKHTNEFRAVYGLPPVSVVPA